MTTRSGLSDQMKFRWIKSLFVQKCYNDDVLGKTESVDFLSRPTGEETDFDRKWSSP